jgi:translation elongation factor EF-Tu-like GTPase
MAKANLRYKTHVNIGTIGHRRPRKTTLTAAKPCAEHSGRSHPEEIRRNMQRAEERERASPSTRPT